MYDYALWIRIDNKYKNFCFPEVQKIFAKYNISSIKKISDKLICFQSESDLSYTDPIIKEILIESIFIESICKIYLHCSTFDECLLFLKNEKKRNFLEQKFVYDLNKTKTRSIRWYFYNSSRSHNKYTKEEKLEIMKPLFDHNVKICLENSELDFCLIETFDNQCGNNLIIGIIIGRIDFKFKKCEKFKLPNRPILGPTSTDNNLCFIMTNIAGIDRDSFVCDPFYGTGGLLIPSAERGAICFGSEIDRKVINGWTNVYVNRAFDKKYTKSISYDMIYHHYNLTCPCVSIMDIKDCFYKREIFDAIISDPPYGERATKKICISEKGYDKVDPILNYLFLFASKTLKKGGKLVFLFPFENSSDESINSLLNLFGQNFDNYTDPLGQKFSRNRTRYCFCFIRR